MSIAGVGTSLVSLVSQAYQARHHGLEGLSFELFTTASFEPVPNNKVSFFLYRIGIDPTRRHKEYPPVAFGSPARTALSLDLHYLVTVWVTDAEREHQVLQDCMEILEENAIVPTSLLDTNHHWEPDDALKVTLDALSHEDMMRLWDLLEPKYRLSVPYLVRTAKLKPVDQPVAPPVLSRVNIVRPDRAGGDPRTMTAPSASPDRRVSLGSLALRPILYRGASSAGPLASPERPIEGLVVRATTSRRPPIFHLSTNLYGFLDLAPATYRIHLTDPAAAYLPRAYSIFVPDRRQLGVALAAGTPPPAVPQPPLGAVPMRPALLAPISAHTALWGVVATPSPGRAPLPFAWIRATTAQGAYVTYSDLRGQYLIPLDTISGVGTFPVQVDAYALVLPPASGAAEPLSAFPASPTDFDDLIPGSADFIAVYGTSTIYSQSKNITIGTQVRLDL